jgi:hypothetical protein
LSGENLLLVALVVAKVVVNLGLDQHYGYFRDELYYMNLGERVWEGPTAMPLLAPLLMALTLQVLGDSLTALHVLPVVAGSLVVVLTLLMARSMGGGLLAQAMAGISVLLAPVLVGTNSTFSYDSFDQLFWVACLNWLVRLLKSDDGRWWKAFGVTAGLGLLTKETMLCLGFGVAVAFLLLPERRHYGTRWMWLGAGISVLFLIPFLVMQAQLGWPSLGYYGTYGSSKTYAATPLEFLKFQVMVMNPVAAPLWAAGLAWALFARAGRVFRALGLVYVILFVLFVVLRAKFYFLAALYPFLLAGGAVWAEGLVARRGVRTILCVYTGLIMVSGMGLASYAMPLLPLDVFIRLASRTSGDLGVRQERHRTNVLPQHFADRFGWEELAGKVVAVYRRLSPGDQAKACIFASNYGEAGAIRFFGKRLAPDLPPVLSGHGQNFYWGFGACTGEVMILVGLSQEDLARLFESHEMVDRTQCEHAMPHENNLPIFVARGLKVPLREIWPTVGRFN